MRKIPSSGAASVAMAEFSIHSLSPQQSAPETAPCDSNKCPWWPYTSSKEFKANTALIIVVLFCALICALAFNAAVRYVIRLHCNRRRWNRKDDSAAEMSVEIPALVYSEGMKLAGAEVSECIICLSEFAVGEKIRVLDKCNHGFHLHCIQRWFVCHSSCPTCRANCCDESNLHHLHENQ